MPKKRTQYLHTCPQCHVEFVSRYREQRCCSYRCRNHQRSGPLVEHFWKHVQRGNADDCWLWMGVRFSTGYGAISWRGQNTGTHRISWELHNGPIPRGLWILHRCDNPPCVNPAHLFLGTAADNNRDMANKGRAAKGAANGSVKLTTEQVHAIRVLLQMGLSQRSIAHQYAVGQTSIWNIAQGRTWTHL